MQRFLQYMSLFLFLLGSSAFASDYILATEAKVYEGYIRKVCGEVATVDVTEEAIYLNFVQPYPKEPFYGFIWREDLADIGPLEWVNSLEQQEVCLTGHIDSYENVPLMIITDKDQVEVINL